ncbi:MAG: flagellar export chaperone FliS [Hyphomonadaceae bacterium]|nr:flagellar export chaperone FliS [Clostridia bacterium]
MAILNPYQQYQQQSVLTANSGNLTLLLYNGCIKFIGKTRLLIINKDIQGAHNANVRAQLIIEEFMCTLDMQYDIAKKMMPIYEYLHRRLVEANIKKDIAILDEVLGFVTELRDTWEEVLKITKSK